MTKRILKLALLLLISSWCASAYASPSIDGDWVGGIDFEKWQPINFHIVGINNGFSGTIDFPNQNKTGLALAKITLNNRRVRIEWEGESGLGVFAGVFNSDSISGQFSQANKTAPFGLVRVAKIDPKLNEEYSGSYQLGRDRFIDIEPLGDLIKFIDSQTRNTRYLYPASETSFVSGPSVRIPFPVQVLVT